ncbi:MAG: hypothetical protein KAX38_01040, partial [Candidatus Krumholzibacteria bacterium]|nr:hypothetical protein [Candidatus Krumholzibacteria bacterium]
MEKCPARVVRVEAGGDEYFLIENRAAELDGLLTGFVVDENGVIIGTGNCMNCYGDTLPPELEWEPTNGYDIMLYTESLEPAYDGGPGVLIWHIDERLIAQRWEENTVNSIYPFGVTLLEASGVVDLGDPSSPFGMGWYDDAYYEGNNTTLSDSTLPVSWSNWGVPTGVRVERISLRDTLMSFGAGVRDITAAKFVGSDAGFIVNGALPLPGSYETLLIDELGNVWIAGAGSPVCSLLSRVVAPPALALEFDSVDDAVIIGERRGLIHAFKVGDWTEFDNWPCNLHAPLLTHPAIVRTEGGVYVAAADSGGWVHLLGSNGVSVGGFPKALSDYERVLGNLVVTADSLGVATGILYLSGGLEPDTNAWLIQWDIGAIDIGGEPQIVEGYPIYIGFSPNEIKGGVALVGGDIDPLEPGEEVYIISYETGRIILCGKRGILAQRNRERHITTIPAVHDLNGDSYLDLIYTDGHSVYAINPSGANLTGWPRRLADIYHLPWEVKVTTPITAAGTPSSGLVAVGTGSGLLYAFDLNGELIGGFPRKVSSSFESAVDLLGSGRPGLFGYLDDLRREKVYPGIEGDQGGGCYRWRRAPFDPEALDRSWQSAWGNVSRTAFARPSEGVCQAGEWIGLARKLIVYPNPSRGDEVKFHFIAPDEGQAFLEIMTLTGELVL